MKKKVLWSLLLCLALLLSPIGFTSAYAAGNTILQITSAQRMSTDAIDGTTLYFYTDYHKTTLAGTLQVELKDTHFLLELDVSESAYIAVCDLGNADPANVTVRLTPSSANNFSSPNKYVFNAATMPLSGHSFDLTIAGGTTSALNLAFRQSAPVASDVSFTGSLCVGETLTGSYTYSDADGDSEGVSTFRWYRSDNASGNIKDAIVGANAKTYVLASADEGKYISFYVTPVAATGIPQGEAVESAISGPVAPAPTVTSVTVAPATASVEKGGSKSFTAEVNGTNNPAQTVTWTVEGGTASTIDASGNLSVAANETAATLTVRATSTVDTSKSGTATLTVTMSLTGLTLSTGAPVVGTPITATVEPEGATVSYQWYKNNSDSTINSIAILGADSASYTPNSGDAGMYLYCVATGTGSYSGTKTALAAKAVAAAPPATSYLTAGLNSGGGNGPDPETVYQTVEGAGGIWAQGAPRGCSFTFDAPLNKLKSVQVDGVTVAASNYDKREGSTIITLHANYLATLSAGRHTLRVNFSDGYAQTTFTIAEKEETNPNTGIGADGWFFKGVLFALQKAWR